MLSWLALVGSPQGLLVLVQLQVPVMSLLLVRSLAMVLLWLPLFLFLPELLLCAPLLAGSSLVNQSTGIYLRGPTDQRTTSFTRDAYVGVAHPATITDRVYSEQYELPVLHMVVYSRDRATFVASDERAHRAGIQSILIQHTWR